MQKRLVVLGDGVAAVVADVAGRLPALADTYHIAYANDAIDAERASAERADVVFEQVPDDASMHRVAGAATTIRFPVLSSHALWPFNCVNPFNRPEPGFPHGPFPYGDSFLIACAQADVPFERAMKLFASFTWSPTWPDLDAALEADAIKLRERDARTDVGIGRYILDHYALQRLFLNVHSPSDHLIGELVARLVAAVPGSGEAVRADVAAALHRDGTRDLLGSLEIPVHPLVARHYRLRWYDPKATYNYFDRARLNTRAYFDRFYTYVLAAKRACGGDERVAGEIDRVRSDRRPER